MFFVFRGAASCPWRRCRASTRPTPTGCRYVIDGFRSLLFYDGTLEAARLEGGWRDALPLFGGRDSGAAGLEDAVLGYAVRDA